jgi:uncharacterized membrane protein
VFHVYYEARSRVSEERSTTNDGGHYAAGKVDIVVTGPSLSPAMEAASYWKWGSNPG